jgi:very-short-patch-repair endonuclease
MPTSTRKSSGEGGVVEGKKANRLRSRKAKNVKYVQELLARPTRAEVVVKDYLDKIGAVYIFQHGMITPIHRIYDFYFPEIRVALEVDGSSHYGKESKDAYKDDLFLRIHGIKTFRVTNNEVFAGTYQSKLRRLLKGADAHDPKWKEPKGATIARRKIEAVRNSKKKTLPGWGVM